MKKRLMALMLAAVLAGGCSVHGDISKRFIVTVAAVTRQDGGCRVTVEYLTQLGSEEKTYESRSGEGKTFAQAVSRLETAVGKELYLDGCKVLLLDGFRDRGQLEAMLEEVDAHGGIRPLTLVAVSADASPLPEGKEKEEQSAGEEIFSLLTGGELSRVNLGDCLNLLNTPGRGLLLPMVEQGEQGMKVCGYLSPGTRGMLRAPAELGSLLPFAKPGKGGSQVYTVTGQDYSADWVLEQNRLAIHPMVREGEPAFLLEAKVEGYLLSHRGEPEGRELVRRAQEDICRQLLEEYGYVLEKISRNSGNDIFSLGKHLELKERNLWQKTGNSWEEKLPEIGIELRADVLLRDKKRLPDRG